jgi:hypothetical protein
MITEEGGIATGRAHARPPLIGIKVLSTKGAMRILVVHMRLDY